jgi:hypothetical protein
MNADCKGALAQLNKSYKAFVHNGNSMSKQAVKEVLEYAISRGYDHTGMLRDAEIDSILTKGTTIEQWDRYYADLKSHEERVEREKPIPIPLYFTHYRPTPNWPVHAETRQQAELIYWQALSSWEMMRSCDAPNKPGYYRANND